MRRRGWLGSTEASWRKLGSVRENWLDGGFLIVKLPESTSRWICSRRLKRSSPNWRWNWELFCSFPWIPGVWIPWYHPMRSIIAMRRRKSWLSRRWPGFWNRRGVLWLRIWCLQMKRQGRYLRKTVLTRNGRIWRMNISHMWTGWKAC